MSNKNEVFEYLIDQLRQQVNNNLYKQQCEDMAHEVLSLKNQLRDASAQIKELREDNIKKSRRILHLTGQVKELHMALVKATGDVEAYKLIREQEQSSCRKEDTHSQGTGVSGRVREGGVRVTGCQSECSHLWHYTDDHLVHCVLCGLKRSDEAQ